MSGLDVILKLISPVSNFGLSLFFCPLVSGTRKNPFNSWSPLATSGAPFLTLLALVNSRESGVVNLPTSFPPKKI